jgi:predicted enzyme related to lactoylglutathione lyase
MGQAVVHFEVMGTDARKRLQSFYSESFFAEVVRLGGSRVTGPDDLGGFAIGLFKDPEGHTIGVTGPA